MLTFFFLFPPFKTFQAYEELGKLGEGTYGTVLRCRHRATGELVAVKRFKESGEENAVRKRRAERESRVLEKGGGRPPPRLSRDEERGAAKLLTFFRPNAPTAFEFFCTLSRSRSR